VPLDAAVREFLDAANEVNAQHGENSVAQRRASILSGSDRLFSRFAERPPDVAVQERRAVDDRTDVRVRVYRPDDSRTLPVHVFLHGGAFWLGSVDEAVVDATCRERAAGAACVVISVDYRLAPEHRFPAAVQDCVTAVRWAHREADLLNVDPDNISIGGVSAGANLAAAVALALRDTAGPRLRRQVLEVPLLDLTLETMIRSGVGDAYGITAADLRACVQAYLPTPEAAREPFASPLLAPDLRDLPPARILTAEFDPLRDDGALYAKRLRDADVPVTYSRHERALHGSLILTRTWAPARMWRGEVVRALRTAHWPGNPGQPPTLAHDGAELPNISSRPA
jgi:acetyl esterase